MAINPSGIKNIEKLAADNGVKIKVTDSGKSVYVNDKKHSDEHYAKENIKKK